MSTNVKPIPDGYNTIIPHLVVKGAADAIEFYKKAFGAVEVMRAPGPDGKTIMHAEIRIGDQPIFLGDEFPEMNCKGPLSYGGTAVTIHRYVENVDAAFERAVAAGAEARMPVQDMFWGDRYGVLADPFGHSWSLATHKEELSPEDLGKRAESAFAACGS